MTGYKPGRVAPLGNPRIKACLAAPRGLSQPTASFIAFQRQGIHQLPLVSFFLPQPSPLFLSKSAPESFGLGLESEQEFRDQAEAECPAGVRVKERLRLAACASCGVCVLRRVRLACVRVHRVIRGGGERNRTDDPLRARQVLSQLSYTPTSIDGGPRWT